MPTSTALAMSRQQALEAVDRSAVEAFADFIRLKVGDGDASLATAATYRANVGDFYLWCQATGVSPSVATEEDIELYRRHLAEAKVPRQTARARLAAVRRFFDAMVWRGLRRDNPAGGVRAKKDKTDRSEAIKYLPADYLQRLLAVCPDGPTGVRDRAILTLFALHGARVGEMVGLDLGDLDLTNDPATCRIREGKGAKSRTLYLVPSDIDALSAWLQIRGEVIAKQHAERAGPFGDALFVSLRGNQEGDPGRRMTTRSIRRRVDRYLDLAGLSRRGVSCHALRHSFGVWSAASGVQVEVIQDEMGHASLTTTSTYVRAARRIKDNPALALERFFGLRDG